VYSLGLLSTYREHAGRLVNHTYAAPIELAAVAWYNFRKFGGTALKQAHEKRASFAATRTL